MNESDLLNDEREIPLWLAMSDETFDACIEAIRKRTDFLVLSRGANPPLYAAKGMVSLRTLLHVLACRHLQEVDAAAIIQAVLLHLLHTSQELPDALRPKVVLHWRYVAYCNRFSELSGTLQASVRSGGLTLRSAETRAPIRQTELDDWLNQAPQLDCDVVRLYPHCSEWNPTISPWPDALVIPPGGLLIAEAERWVEDTGIAEPGELRSLLKLPSAVVVELAKGSDFSECSFEADSSEKKEWTNEEVLCRYEQIVQELGGKHGARKRLIAETGIEPTKLLRMRKMAREARLSPMSTMRSVVLTQRGK